MAIERLAVLGVGDLRTGPAVIGSLANYFGERELEVRMWDPQAEVLDIMDLFARECFKWRSSEHRLVTMPDLDEALEDVDAVIICANCGASVASFTDIQIDGFPVLDLVESHLDWRPEISEAESIRLRFDILRTINREDYLFHLVNDYKQSPVVDWLNTL